MNHSYKKDLKLPFVNDAPVTRLSDYLINGQHLDHETMFGVANAKVIFANYEVIKSDFPNQWDRITKGVDCEEAAIDKWLVENTAFISNKQAHSSCTNNSISLTGVRCRAWRPSQCNRSAILGQPEMYEEDSRFLFDVKGNGVSLNEDPKFANTDGFMTLSEAIHEVIIEHLIFASMVHATVDIRPMPAYGVVDLGFSVWSEDDHKPERAVLLLRRATIKHQNQREPFEQEKESALVFLKTELLFRKYGLSSSNCASVGFNVLYDGIRLIVDRDGQRIKLGNTLEHQLMHDLHIKKGNTIIIDGINIQTTNKMESNPTSIRIMDFEGYKICSRFRNDLYASVDTDYQNLKGIFLSRKDKKYIQPDPLLSFAQITADPSFVLLNQLVENYEKNHIDAIELAKLLQEVITSATVRLNKNKAIY
ncbi:hypothetical protein [Aquimarina sediminis]|uniref:hypothetical protein n=1 Tax=Aquimarina sediminis TaxID=2070536 RepID=UPI000CA067AB|nr:hypothetical protein [Aquimarina sediminis]